MKTILSLLSASATAALLASPASGQGSGFPSPLDDAAHGKAIAEAWCSSCHLVAPGDNRTALADIPTFTSIARQLPSNADVLTAFVVNPHPPYA